MTQYVKPAVLPAWADSGDKTQPTNLEIQTGWPLSMTPPSRQRFNWILNYNMAAARYFAQNGIPEWDAAEDYPLYARVRVGAQTYRSISGTSNVGMNPTTEPTFWTPWGADTAGNSSQVFSVAAPTAVSHAVRADTSFMPVQSITATAAAGAITATVKPTAINFRSSTLTSGIAVARILAADATLVIPSGATLGMTTIDPAQLILLLIDNAGTLEVAVTNRATSASLDESGVISTTAISAGSTSANTFYSTTARTNVAYRVVGGLTAVNTTGAWGNPSLVWGAGGGGMATSSTITTESVFNITATSAAGAMTVGSPGGTINFHATDLTDGLSVPITFGATSLVAPSGATFGIASNSRGRVLVCLINNAGTVEMALISKSSESAALTEMGLISTTAISVGSTSANVFYSTTARTDVAYRVIGVIEVVNTAGAWGAPAYVSGLYGLVSTTVSSSYGAGAIFGYGWNGATPLTISNLVSNTGVVATDTTGVGTARHSLAAARYGGDKAIFGYGWNGSADVSMTNLVSNTGVVATDTTGVGTARSAPAAAGYGSDKAIFGYGRTGSEVSMSNLVSNTGVVATDTTGVGTARHLAAAAGYGSDKAIFGYGWDNATDLSMTNLVSNTGVVATDTTGVGTARRAPAAAGYGGDKAIFGYGRDATSALSMTNLVSNTGVVATDTTGVGTARYALAAAGYGGDKAIFGYGTNGTIDLSISNLVSNTGVVATDTTGVGTARSGLAAAGYGV